MVDVWKTYAGGGEPLHALKSVDLTIEPGEMVAIIGASGSGKSTLMNVLGCLDRPTRGHFLVDGQDTDTLSADEIARLRREHFGFVFQRYQLLSDLDARGNVETPAIYTGMPSAERRSRAEALLATFGLSERSGHKPAELSGGQQQRVSIARALMNGGEVLFADEPTGALDSRSGAELIGVLQSLNASGKTVVVVTHDPNVAAHADRIIELRDGVVVSDTVNARRRAQPIALPPSPIARLTGRVLGPVETLRLAIASLLAHRLRTGLTMLGIVIGIASVVSVFALIGGAKTVILTGVGAMGADTVRIAPGRGLGDARAGGQVLSPQDLAAVAAQPFVDSVTPTAVANALVKTRATSSLATVFGVNAAYFRVQNIKLARGRGLVESGDQQEAVIDAASANRLFGTQDPLGQILLVGPAPFRVVGVVEASGGLSSALQGDRLQVWLPYDGLNTRVARQAGIAQIVARLRPSVASGGAVKALTETLRRTRGQQDFFVLSSDTLRQQIDHVALVFSVLLGAIGGISLVVGGVGVMNTMLVTVSERTREIGVRRAVGARRRDIQAQFILEAVLVCLTGGVAGVALSMILGALFETAKPDFHLVYAPGAIAAALGAATITGVIFGWLPARRAAGLDPVKALAAD
ncbi:ABC transporter permease [Caulobacter sp. 1776]|uniref:ABC transporter permease n=1 Tax=Caulobacter sp. 1776 TaxID=3156420 RepID=UPI003399E0BB